MPEGIEDVEQAFATEIAPPTRPRDHQGKFIRETANPEQMFEERRVEGDPLTGDTSDGGDDPILVAREKEVLDGDERARRSAAETERESRERRGPNRAPQRDDADADDGYGVPDSEPENISAELEPDADEGEGSQVEDGEDGSPRYEVTVDGQTHQVSLNEALSGYVRQATFHQRMQQLSDAARAVEEDHARLQQNWAWWHKARRDYEEDVIHMTPQEPNWDDEFARDPARAYDKRKTFETIYSKLAASQQLRAQREAAEQEERDRRTEKYAVDGFSTFVMNHLKAMPDEPTLRRNIQSMRRTASTAGFNELEIATVYDPRMLEILWKASKYDRMVAAQPRAVAPGKGKSMAPGVATPISGNARRSGVDDAQRQLAKTGRVSDAAEVFRRLL